MSNDNDCAYEAVEKILHRRPAKATRVRRYASFTSYDVELAPGTRPIYLYLRRSKFHGDPADTIERTRVELRAMLEAEGCWTIMGEYVDNDSASKSATRGRNGYTRMVEALHGGRLPALAFWSLDRIDRVADRMLKLLREFRETETELRSAKHSVEELRGATVGAKVAVGVTAVLAEAYSDTISEKVYDKKASAAKAGFNHGGQVPLGWQLGPEVVDEDGLRGRKLVAHPIEHPALRKAVEMVLDGHSVGAVTAYWRDELGIVANDGMAVPQATLLRSLRSPRLLGYRLYQVPEFKRGVKVNLMDYVVRKQDGTPVIAQPAVVDDERTWHRLQRVLDDRSNVSARRPWGSHEWLLSGLLRCGGCGLNLQGGVKHGRAGKRTFVYRCHANRTRGTGTCVGVSINGPATEAFALGWLSEYLGTSRLDAELLRQQETEAEAVTDGIKAKLEDLRGEFEVLKATRRGVQGGLMLRTVLDDMAEVAERIAEAEAALAAVPLPHAPEHSVIGRWDDLTLDQRRHVLRQCIARISISPSNGERKFDAGRIAVVPRW